MKYTTIFEKILCIFDLISKSWLDIAFVGIATIFLILLACKKLSKKKCFLFVMLACFGLLTYTIYQYFEPLSKMMNTLVDNVFTNIYFPSTYAYLFILIVTDIVAIVNLLNPKTEKVYKTIHGTYFIIINFILTIVLEMIAKYEIDIFSKKSLFSNTDFITLLEFSMNIFIVWLIALLVVYLINMITERIVITKERKVLKSEPANIVVPEITVSNDEIKEDDQISDAIEVPTTEVNAVAFVPDTTQSHFIPTFVAPVVEEVPNAYRFEKPFVAQPAMNQFAPSQPVLDFQQNQNTNIYQTVSENTFDLSSFIPKQQEIHPIQNFNTQTNTTNQIFEQILRNELPVVHEDVTQNVVKDEFAVEKDNYTLNDYRIFNKMLKDIREHNQSNSIRIDKNLEYRLITKYSTETYHMFQKMLKIYAN